MTAPDPPSGSVDPEWLADVLRGTVPRGRILSVTERGIPAIHSDVRHLVIQWTDAPPDAPRNLVWKRPRHDDRELAIYGMLGTIAGLPVPRCYAMGEGWLLLEDLSTGYRAPVTRDDLLAGNGVPAPGAAERVVDALADFHAACWEHPRLGHGEFVVRNWFRDQGVHALHVERRRREWAEFLAKEPDTPYRDVYERALEVVAALWTPEWADRMATRRSLTLVQGDAYLNQFVVPLQGDGPARILDFGDATANPGAWDLAFALTTFWTGKQRGAGGREQGLLQRYAARLAARGVDVTEDEILRDYRWMVAYLVFDPVWNCTDGSSRAYWEPKMRCLTTAWQDLGCGALPE